MHQLVSMLAQCSYCTWIVLTELCTLLSGRFGLVKPKTSKTATAMHCRRGLVAVLSIMCCVVMAV